jgi:hypothetical protein
MPKILLMLAGIVSGKILITRSSINKAYPGGQ